MTHLLVVILHDLSRLPDLLQAWKRVGVPGVTIVRTVGGYQAEGWLGRIGLGGLGRLLEHEDVRQRTLLSVISDDELLELAIAEADAVVEGFDRPHSGILFTVPVGRALGIRKRGHAVVPPELAAAVEKPAEAIAGNKTKVAQIVTVLNLEPVRVSTQASLPEILEVMLAYPSVHLACVINDEQRLVGVIDLTMLANGFFFSIFPEKFIGELRDIDQVLDFASQTHKKVAADLMQEPAWVKMEDNLEKAFELMHARRLPGLPVVDDHYHIIGYINLLELIAVSLRGTSPTEKGVGE